MAAISLPASLVPSSTEVQIVTNDREYLSPQSGAAQYAGRIGNRIGLSMTFSNLNGDERRTLFGFLMQLAGHQNTLRTKIHSYVRGAGASVGVGATAGSTAAGALSVLTDGWDVSTLVFKQGDMIQLGSQLTFVTQDVTSNSSGFATLPVYPELHKVVANNTTVVYTDPTGDFFLAEMPSLPSVPKSAADYFTSTTIRLIQDVLA